jgi:hypothetical protein
LILEQILGSIKRKDFKSLLRDTWILIDAQGSEIATIIEDSQFMALLRRFLLTLISQTFHVKMGEQEVAKFHRAFNPL